MKILVAAVTSAALLTACGLSATNSSVANDDTVTEDTQPADDQDQPTDEPTNETEINVPLNAAWTSFLHCTSDQEDSKSTIDILALDDGNNQNPIKIMYVSTNRNFPTPFAMAFGGLATMNEAGDSIAMQAYKDGVLSDAGKMTITAIGINGKLVMSENSTYSCKNPL